MTPERALADAQLAEEAEYTWKHERAQGALAHQFGRLFGWMTSRCGTARWTVAWWSAPDDAPRCAACSEISTRSIDTRARAIVEVNARPAVPA